MRGWRVRVGRKEGVEEGKIGKHNFSNADAATGAQRKCHAAELIIKYLFQRARSSAALWFQTESC